MIKEEMANAGDNNESYVQSLFRAEERRKLAESPYLDLKFIPATFAIAERGFSQSSLVYTELRRCIKPLHLECALFLKHNNWFLSSTLIDMIINEKGVDN